MMQSSPFNLSRLVIWAGRLVLAGIFIYAGYAKLFLPNFPGHVPIAVALKLFALQVDSYQMLQPRGVALVANILPFAEIALGLLLLIGWQLRVWATIVTIVIAGFFVVVARSYAMGLQINCGCFANPEPLTKMTVLRDGLLVALALAMTILAFLEARRPHPWTAKAGS